MQGRALYPEERVLCELAEAWETSRKERGKWRLMCSVEDCARLYGVTPGAGQEGLLDRRSSGVSVRL